MDDLISRKALMKYMRDYKWEFALNSDFSKAIEMVDVQPTVEAKEVVHGEWINEYINRYGHPCHCCSVCGFHASHQDKNFCPECGADMRKKENKENDESYISKFRIN